MGLLVIFGAGASYDSIDPGAFDDPHPNTRWANRTYFRPPLAAELFEDRLNFNEALKAYPHFIGRVADLRRKAKPQAGLNVEHELEQMKAQAEHYPPATVELAAMRFYLRRVLWECGEQWQITASGATNYAELLRRIEQWRLPRKERVVLVTFNYDVLLDMAAAAFPVNLKVNSIDDYIAREDYKLIKPHGSVNWGQLLDHHPEKDLPDPDVTRLMIEQASRLKFTDKFAVTGLGVRKADLLYFPAIAIPVESKSDFACPQAHLTALVQALTSWRTRSELEDDMRHVLIIGWRASENHFLDMLKGYLSNKHVLVVAENQAAAEITATNLARADVERQSITCSDKAGFSGFLAMQELEAFLQRAD